MLLQKEMLDFLWKRKNDLQQQGVGPVAVSENKIQLEVPSAQIQERSVVEDLEQLKIYKPAETGFERLKAVFQKNKYGFRSWEFNFCLNAARVGFIAGVFIKFRKNLQPAFERWKRQHSASVFKSKAEAGERARLFTSLNAALVSIPNGLRVGIIVFSSFLTSQCLAAYRDEMRYTDFIVGWYVAGAIYRFPLGFRAVAASSFLGGIAGVFYCFIIWSVLKISHQNTNVDFHYKLMRQEYYEEQIKNLEIQAEVNRIAEEQNVWWYKAYRIYKQRKQLEDEMIKKQLEDEMIRKQLEDEMIKKQQASDNEGNKN